MISRFSARLCAALILVALPCSAQETSPKLTLEAAITRALQQAPLLKSAKSAIAIGQAEKEQAGLLPNPSVQMQAENFAGQGVYQGAQTAEFTVGVAQTIELGGKRGAREALAEQGIALGEHGYNIAHLTTVRETTQAYMDALMAQEQLMLMSEQETLADALLKEVRHRVAAAAVPLVQQSKSEVVLANAQLATGKATREAEHAQHILASLLGGHYERFALDTSRFYRVEAPPGEEVIEAQLEKTPDMQRWEAQKARSKAAYALAQANAVPDPTLSFGVRQLRGVSDGGFGQTNSNAFIAGLSIPIPVFDQNQGNISKARHEMVKAESDEAAAARELRNQAYEAYEALVNAYTQATSLKSSIIPASEKAYTLAREGYGLGRFSYLEVLDAQRSLFEAKGNYLSALNNYHTSAATLERLTGRDPLHATHAQLNEADNEK